MKTWRVMSAQGESAELERALATGWEPFAVTGSASESWLVWLRRSEQTKTGWRFVRGSHSGQFVRDPNGEDTPPPDFLERR